jgi:DNA-nicking Smr family endonuclease
VIRKLTDEEHELWERLRQTVRPLAKRRKPDKPAKKEAAAHSAEPKAAKRRPAQAPRPAAAVPVPPKESRPALAPLDERTRRRLGRGLVSINDRIDLHGMHQERAFQALVSFLRKAQARGDRIVLVVTGKGRASEGGRGVLRASVPAWLARPDLRHLVVGWEEAGRRHGGAGALYIRVRRRRAGRQQEV